MPAFHTVELLARNALLTAPAGNRQSAVVQLDLNVFAAQAGHFSGEDIALGRFVQIARRNPSVGARGKTLQPLLDGEEIANRIPERERHAIDASTGLVGGWWLVVRGWYLVRVATELVLMDINHQQPTTNRQPPGASPCASIDGIKANMASIQATRVKKGMLVKMGEDLFRILDFQHVTPGNLRGFVRVKMRNIRSGTLSDQKLRSEDLIERATLDEREMQYLYKDDDDYYFMDTSSYEQVHISSEALGDSVNYLKPEMTIQVEFYGTEPVGIELPQTVDLKVLDTVPGIKGATASAQVKPATLETGLVVQVPPFVNPGDMIRVNTETGEYLSRA